MDDEQWRPVVGYEGLYEVASVGLVRNARTGRMLKPHRTEKGYLRVGLCRNGQMKIRRVHVLVLESFVGPRPEGWHGCHVNHDNQDNRLENLEWDTPENNAFDAWLHRKGWRDRKAYSDWLRRDDRRREVAERVARVVPDLERRREKVAIVRRVLASR